MTPRDAMVELQARIAASIIGQQAVVERLVIGLLANGNLLLEGLPGLAKTRAVKSLAKNLEADFSRIHRSILVSVGHLEAVEKDRAGRHFVRVSGREESLPVGRRQVSDLKRLLSGA